MSTTATIEARLGIRRRDHDGNHTNRKDKFHLESGHRLYVAPPGCGHCYAKRFAERFKGVAGNAYEQGFALTLHGSTGPGAGASRGMCS